MNKVKIIIAGSRDFTDYSLLEEVVTSVLRNTAWKKGYKNSDIEIVCGKARGADTLGEWYAKAMKMGIAYFPANWQLYGAGAGYIRNEEMAQYASDKPGFGALIALWDGKSKGTKHMIDLAKKYRLAVFVYNYKDGKWFMKK